MQHSRIEAAPFNLFTDKPGIGCVHAVRTATDEEAAAYLIALAERAGLRTFPAMELERAESTGRGRKHVAAIMGGTFGRRIERPTRENGFAPVYENGAYSVPMPGRIRQPVTLEWLDDDGNVIRAQSMPVDPKKGAVLWDRAAVQEAVGKVEKAAKPRKAAKPAKEAVHGPKEAEHASPAADMPEEVRDAIPAADTGGDPIAELNARLDAIEAALAGATAAGPASDADAIPAADNATATKPDDRARRLRIVRRYLAMRAQRDLDRRALMAGGEYCRQVEGERDKARDEVEHYRAIALRNGKGWQEAQAALDAAKEEASRLAKELEKARRPVHDNGASAALIAQIHATKEEAARRVADAESRARIAIGRVDDLAERAIRAENALRAVQARIDRAPAPYAMKRAAVSYAA